MSEPPPPSPLSALERYQLTRQRIEHEDGLVVQRLSWLVGSQSFLFTAYAIVLNGLTSPVAPGMGVYARQQHTLFHALPIVAITSCALILLDILAAMRAMVALRAEWAHERARDRAALPAVSVQTSGLTLVLGHAAPVLLPLVFIGVWLYLAMRAGA